MSRGGIHFKTAGSCLTSGNARFVLIIVAIMACFARNASASGDVSPCQAYVAPNGTDTATCGMSELTACASLQWAISLGVSGSICMLPGLHTRSVNVAVSSSQALNIVGIDGDVLVDCQGNSTGWSFMNTTVAISGIMLANCVSSSRGGAALYIDGDLTTIMDCLFLNNTVIDQNGGAVWINNMGTVNVSGCDFMFNSANDVSDGGGGIYIYNSNGNDGDIASVTINHCSFTGNNANNAAGGGGMYINNNGNGAGGTARVTINNCSFSGNNANNAIGGGGVSIYNINKIGTAPVTINNCIFSGNNASDGYGGGGIFIYNSNNAGYSAASVTITNCSYIGNSATSSTLGNSNLSQTTGGGDVHLTLVTLVSVVHIVNCVFMNSAALTGGAVFATGLGTFDVQGCVISNSVAVVYGGGIFVTDGVTLITSDATEFSRNNATFGAALFALSSTITISNTSFVENEAIRVGGGVVLDGGTHQFTNVLFAECGAPSGGGALVVYFGQAILLNSIFSANQAPYGGAILVSSSGQVDASYSKFGNNSASVQGGAIDVQGVALLRNCAFVNNSAPFGGALYMEVPIPSYQSQAALLSCYNCSFFANSATQGGACMFWTGLQFQPECLECFHDGSNRAAYGNWSATPPLDFVAALQGDTFTRTSTVRISAQLLDWYNQSVVRLPAVHVAVIVGGGQIQGSGIMPYGSAAWNVTVPGKNANVTLQLQASLLLSNVLHVTVGQCAAGYGYSGDVCELCPAGSYTWNTTVPCRPCDANIVCSGGTNTAIASNYWPNIHVVTGQVEAMLCPFDFCAQNDTSGGNIFASTMWCRLEAMRDAASPLCGECLPGYSGWSHQCVPCTGPHAGAISLQLLQLFGVVLLQRILSQGGSGTTGFVNLVFVYQFAQFALYPKPLLQTLLNVFNLQLPAASSLGCPFPTNGYGQLAVQLCIPLVCIAMLGLIFAFHRGTAQLVERYNWSERRPVLQKLVLFVLVTSGTSAYVRTFIVLCLNLYETVLEAAFNFLVCVQSASGDVNVVYLYPSIWCNTTQYSATRVVLCVLIAAFVLFPAFIIVWLYWQLRQHGSLKHLHHRYGRLFGDYQEQFYWWECLMLWRRAILLTVFVPLAGTSLPVAKAAMLACVTVFLALHTFVLPFKHSVDNKLESLSLLTLGALIGIFANDTLGRTLQSVLGGVLLVCSGIVLIAPSVHTAVVKVVDAVRKLAMQRPMSQLRESESGVTINDTLIQPLV